MCSTVAKDLEVSSFRDTAILVLKSSPQNVVLNGTTRSQLLRIHILKAMPILDTVAVRVKITGSLISNRQH